jgi:hypothetical protein
MLEPQLTLNPDHPRPTGLYLRRVVKMMLGWALLGAIVGAGALGPAPGWVGVAAGMVAGVLVLPPIGGVLGLIGARAGESLLGSMGGWGLGLLAGSLHGQVWMPGALGLITGAFLGATLPLFYRLCFHAVPSS